MYWNHTVRNNEPIAFFQQYNDSQKITYFGLIKYNSKLSEEYGTDYWNYSIWVEHCGIKLDTVEFKPGLEIWLTDSFNTAKQSVIALYRAMLTEKIG